MKTKLELENEIIETIKRDDMYVVSDENIEADEAIHELLDCNFIKWSNIYDDVLVFVI